MDHKPSVQIYAYKIENRVKFKIKNGYSFKLLTPETMKLLGSTEKKITRYKNVENVPHLEIIEVVLVHCDIVNNDQIGKRQLHFVRLNNVLLDLNKFWKDTAFMFTFAPFSCVKLTASKSF